jgi:aminopeptidase N
VIGDDKFWAGIRGYYRRHRDAVASTADFRRAMEEAAGSDLRWFFDEWLYRGGLPKIEGGWHYDPAAKRIEIELSQRQPGPVFRMPVDIAIMTTGVETRTERLQIAERTGAFSIPSDQPPASVVIDPGVWALMDVAFSKR